jgi:hypothetical protein
MATGPAPSRDTRRGLFLRRPKEKPPAALEARPGPSLGSLSTSLAQSIRPGVVNVATAAGPHHQRTTLIAAPRVIHFAQTHSTNARQIFRLEESMPALKNDKFKDYARYAEHCLDMVASTRDQELRRIQREMAAEWMRLADEIRRPLKLKQMQMG